ncbi:MAG: hypothetical protein L6300_12960, partial [Syntrophaceae bacterium]|nr:hypothetical protein [Syntrophaceae bacterium]
MLIRNLNEGLSRVDRFLPILHRITATLRIPLPVSDDRTGRIRRIREAKCLRLQEKTRRFSLLSVTSLDLPVDYEAYSSVSVTFKEVLRTVSPIMEDVGIDEAYLDVTDIPETNEEITGRIKAGIKEKTGLTCSIGIASNKLLAKIASDMQKPDGVTVLTEADVETKLWPLPVRKLYGIGPKTEEHLKGINIETIGQLAALPLEKLLEHFGNSYGQYLYEAA